MELKIIVHLAMLVFSNSNKNLKLDGHDSPSLIPTRNDFRLSPKLCIMVGSKYLILLLNILREFKCVKAPSARGSVVRLFL